MFKLLAFVAILLTVAHASHVDDPRMTEDTKSVIEVLEYNATKSCCQLDFVKFNHATVLSQGANVISLNNSQGIFHPILSNNIPKFISQSEMKSSPWKRIKSDYFLSNPNGCDIRWTSNYTEGIADGAYVPTFKRYMLTDVKYIARRRPAWGSTWGPTYRSTYRPSHNSSENSTENYVQDRIGEKNAWRSWHSSRNRVRAMRSTTTTSTTTQAPKVESESKRFSKFYSLSDNYSIRSGYAGYDQVESTRSLLYIACPAQAPKLDFTLLNEELRNMEN